MPPAARLTDMHSCPMQTPAWPSPISACGWADYWARCPYRTDR